MRHLQKPGADSCLCDSPSHYLPVKLAKDLNSPAEKHRIIRQHFAVTNIVRLHLLTINSW